MGRKCDIEAKKKAVGRPARRRMLPEKMNDVSLELIVEEKVDRRFLATMDPAKVATPTLLAENDER